MSPFRLFGPPPEPEPAVAAHDDSGGVTWAAGSWAHDPAPATRHARPVGLDTRPASGLGRNAPPAASRHRPAPPGFDDPPTDPFGFPPIPADPATAWSAPVRSRPLVPVDPPPDPREAAALAGAFAADYLSWTKTTPVGAAGSWPATWPPPRAIPRCSAGTGRVGSARSSPCRVPFAQTGTTACWSTSGCGSRPTAPWVVARPTNPNPDPTGMFRGCLPSHRHRPGRAGRAARRTGSG